MLVFLNSQLTQTYWYFLPTKKQNITKSIYAVKPCRQRKLECREVCAYPCENMNRFLECLKKNMQHYVQ
jgi:hypothetical protein